MQDGRSREITARFFAALDELKGRGRIHSLHDFTRRYGVDYSNFAKLKADHGRNIMQAGWLSVLVLDFGVSADWLLTGRGGVFPENRPDLLPVCYPDGIFTE